MPDYARRTPTRQEQLEEETDRFWTELGDDPPGDRSLIVQLLGWALILQGGALAVVLLESAVGSTWFRPAILLRGLGAAILIATGILVDRANPWGLWIGLTVSVAAGALFAWTYITGGNPLAGVGALWDAGILIGLLAVRERFQNGGGAAG